MLLLDVAAVARPVAAGEVLGADDAATTGAALCVATAAIVGAAGSFEAKRWTWLSWTRQDLRPSAETERRTSHGAGCLN